MTGGTGTLGGELGHWGNGPDPSYYRERGLRAPFESVWSHGRDVTDADPKGWPWPWSMYHANGWRPWFPPVPWELPSKRLRNAEAVEPWSMGTGKAGRHG